MLKVKNLSYKIGSKNILRNISFEAPKGTLTAIIGPNGAGKSSLSKQISSQQINSAAQVLWKEKSLKEYKPECLAGERAVFSQRTDLDAGFDVQEVVMMGRYPYFKYQPSPDDYASVAKALQQCDMKNFSGRQFCGLSGGEQQRVDIARALLTSPKLILADEPTGNLDPETSDEIMNLLIQIARDYGTSVIMATHDYMVIRKFSARMVRTEGGKVIDNATIVH